MSISRFSFSSGMTFGKPDSPLEPFGMKACDDGEFVLYKDHVKAIRGRDEELLRIRTTENASAHALDVLRQTLGLPLIDSEHPMDLQNRIMGQVMESGEKKKEDQKPSVDQPREVGEVRWAESESLGQRMIRGLTEFAESIEAKAKAGKLKKDDNMSNREPTTRNFLAAFERGYNSRDPATSRNPVVRLDDLTINLEMVEYSQLMPSPGTGHIIQFRSGKVKHVYCSNEDFAEFQEKHATFRGR